MALQLVRSITVVPAIILLVEVDVAELAFGLTALRVGLHGLVFKVRGTRIMILLELLHLANFGQTLHPVHVLHLYELTLKLFLGLVLAAGELQRRQVLHACDMVEWLEHSVLGDGDLGQLLHHLVLDGLFIGELVDVAAGGGCARIGPLVAYLEGAVAPDRLET